MQGSARWVFRSDRWVDYVSTTPVVVPRELLSIPGIRYVEPEPGHPNALWKVEIPSTAWSLDSVAKIIPKVPAGPPLVPEWPGLYPYQRDGVQFLLERRGGVLSDQLGLGKSRQAAVTGHLFARRLSRPVLIGGTKYLAETWRREIAAVLGDTASFHVITGAAPRGDQRIPDVDFIFCHYDIMAGWWSQILTRRPAVAIFDEAHMLRNGRTKRGKAAALAAGIATMRLVLTGTPLLNRPSEMMPLLELATGRYTWGSYTEFRTRYAGAYSDAHGLKDGEPTHTDEFQRRLSTCYIRRTETDIGIQLPPARRELLHADLSDAERVDYDALFDGHSPEELVEAILENRAGTRTIAWLGRLRALASDAKYKTTLELARSLRTQGENVVVFSWRRKTATKFADDLDGTFVHGELSQAARDERIATFQANGGALSATYDALSTGVTLDNARIVLLHDLDWVPGQMLQAEGRVTGGLRRGNKHCIAYWVLARGTLDELIVKTVGLKGASIAELTHDTKARDLADFMGYRPETHNFDKLIAWARNV